MSRKPYSEMTPKELAEATKKYDEPLVVDQSRPLSPKEQEQWSEARGKRGRPKVGGGFKRISVSMEQGLLSRVTALAKKRRISRSQLLARVLEETLKD